jgi:2-polyprenyl-6-methoxyphenol hydroxylase-like FAD-dependent oxidoreductase
VKPVKWPLFHHPDTPTYHNGRVVLLGDSAHASSPSQAAGAGQGLEDALVLSRLLGLVESVDQLDTAFQAYDAVRRPRAQRVVQESNEVGIAYFLVHPNFGNNLQKLTDDANRRLPQIWWHDLEGDCKTAENHFKDLVTRS